MYLFQRRQIVANKALEKFKELGYRVYYHQWEHDSEFSTYGYIRSKDGNSVGYWQVSDFAHGIRFGTVHKPCTECGTGYSLQMDDESIPVEDITADHIEATFAFAPSWATKKQRAAIIKYQSFEEWVNSNTRCKTVEL